MTFHLYIKKGVKTRGSIQWGLELGMGRSCPQALVPKYGIKQKASEHKYVYLTF